MDNDDNKIQYDKIPIPDGESPMTIILSLTPRHLCSLVIPFIIFLFISFIPAFVSLVPLWNILLNPLLLIKTILIFLITLLLVACMLFVISKCIFMKISKTKPVQIDKPKKHSKFKTHVFENFRAYILILIVSICCSFVLFLLLYKANVKLSSKINYDQALIKEYQPTIDDIVDIHQTIDKFENAVRENLDLRDFFSKRNLTAEEDINAWNKYKGHTVNLTFGKPVVYRADLEGDDPKYDTARVKIHGTDNGNPLFRTDQVITLIKENGKWKFLD